MSLAIFDLDNTLLAGDSDYLWGQHLVARGVVDGAAYAAANARFYEDYKAGRLDIDAFLAFALRPLRDNPLESLQTWREELMERHIAPLIRQPALDLVARHRAAGDTLLVITATNTFVTAPIVARFGIPHLIATEPEHDGASFTGRVAGTPAFREGKVSRLMDWLSEHDETLAGSHFYSDSINDLPLLERVDHPVAVDPDPLLAEAAQSRGWPVISLHQRVS
ncbi:phosphoserine phosphatase [Thiohalocapsa halophila]|uniref:Phosphoserine phosphatase n=1 Tax=Thiohalocapsa halophila TaxID=69359 RepID=A0ABS1CM53_9GAMM|nr:HAD family hydrolase [Thiohalocapsa halophila]MBK1633022.1 phosphoserine phosphatase [Thiohalocapsa halophila]